MPRMKSKAFTASVLIRDIRVIRGSEQKVWNREWRRIHANEAQTTENQVVPRARRVCGVNDSKVDVFCSGAQALRVNQQYASSKVPDPDPTAFVFSKTINLVVTVWGDSTNGKYGGR